MHSGSSHSSFTKELTDFACRLASFSALASQSRNLFERPPRIPGMARKPASGYTLEVTKIQPQPKCPKSIERLCRGTALKRPQNPERRGNVSQAPRQDDSAETAIDPLILVKPYGFNQIVEVTLSLPGSVHGATARAPDFMSQGISMLTNSGTFRVASSGATAAKWRKYLNEGTQDTITLAANRWLISATMKKALTKPQENAGQRVDLFTSHDQWQRVCLTLRIFKTDGGRRRQSHICNWSASMESAK